MSRQIANEVADALGTDSTRLLQKIELFVETVSPSLAVFIDDTNQDLTDFCNALDVPTETYRVKKLMVNGTAELYSPDHHAPALVTVPEQSNSVNVKVFDVIEQLGGGEVIDNRLKLYQLADGRVVKVQSSKFHERHQTYWYGITPSSYAAVKAAGCSQILFVMADDGFVELPIADVDEYLKSAYVSSYPDGAVKHYHVYIAPPPDVALKGYGNADDTDVRECFSAWN